MSRYQVDKRVGCVAIIDTTMTDPDHQGLHSDDIGVVRYWAGVNGPEGWMVPRDDLDSADKLCKELNRMSEGAVA